MCVLGQGKATERDACHVAKKQDHTCVRGRAKNGCTWLCERGGVILYQGGGQCTSDERGRTSDATRLINSGIVFCKQEVFVGWDYGCIG